MVRYVKYEHYSRLFAERIINEGSSFNIEDDNEEKKNVLYLSTSVKYQSHQNMFVIYDYHLELVLL